MQEVTDQYIEAKMMLSRGDQTARGHEVAQSCNANRYVVSRDHANSILDAWLYQVKFDWGMVTVLTNNHCRVNVCPV